MTTIRRITVSQIDGNDANNNEINEIRPFGETAFYLDTSGEGQKLTLMMFDGVRTHQKSKVLSPGVLFGSNADSGDGGGYDTIKLIPDAALGTDQYIVVDPTGGEPGHIHLRAGGTQDQSFADLYLGGELTNVRVSDPADNVRVRTSFTGEGVQNYDWTFDNTGKLTLPQGGAIEAHGMGWTGLTNGTSGNPVSIAYKNTYEGSSATLSEILLVGGPTEGNVNIYTQDTVAQTSWQWTFDEAGVTAIPGPLTFSSNGANATGNSVTTAIDDDYAISTQRYQTVSGLADITSDTDNLFVDISETDDIIVVQAGWQINSGSPQAPVWVTVTETSTPSPGVYRIVVPGFGFVPSTTYTFRNPIPTTSTWTFSELGTLTTPGNGTISHLNNDLKLEVSGTDVIVLRTSGGDTVINADGSLTFADSTTQTTAWTGSYTPTTPTDWNGTPPTTIAEAIDRLASVVKTLNGGTGA